MEKSTQPLSEQADVCFDSGIFLYLFCSDNLRKGDGAYGDLSLFG